MIDRTDLETYVIDCKATVELLETELAGCDDPNVLAWAEKQIDSAAGILWRVHAALTDETSTEWKEARKTLEEQ